MNAPSSGGQNSMSMEGEASMGTNSLFNGVAGSDGATGAKRKLSGADEGNNKRSTKINFEQIFEKIDVGTRKTKIICTLG